MKLCWVIDKNKQKKMNWETAVDDTNSYHCKVETTTDGMLIEAGKFKIKYTQTIMLVQSSRIYFADGLYS